MLLDHTLGDKLYHYKSLTNSSMTSSMYAIIHLESRLKNNEQIAVVSASLHLGLQGTGSNNE